MEKNMNYNFENLEKRVNEMLFLSDLKRIKKTLEQIDGPTICVGVGGSSVVAEYASKILSKKNNIIAVAKEPRDLLYENIKQFENVLLCSYSGKNYGVDISLNNSLNRYLLSNNSSDIKGVKVMSYKTEMEREKSFISLASTLMPMAILLSYYLDSDDREIYDSLTKYDYSSEIDRNDIYEIMTGKDTSCASKFLESTFVESGIGVPIIHDKYSYCHGRSTLSYTRNNALIYFYRYTELDNLILEEASKYYSKIILLNQNYGDSLIDDFNLTIKAMYLTKAIAEKKNVDLSDTNYSPIVKKLYRYRGRM